MIDVGTLLRTISKSEDYDIPEIANYLSTYKVFSERVSFVINATMVEEHSDDGLRSVPAALDAVREVLNDPVPHLNLCCSVSISMPQLSKIYNFISFCISIFNFMRGFKWGATGPLI